MELPRWSVLKPTFSCASLDASSAKGFAPSDAMVVTPGDRDDVIDFHSGWSASVVAVQYHYHGPRSC